MAIKKGWMKLNQKKKPYFWLMKINLFISAFTFGGGYVVVPMIRRYFVKQKAFFTEEELMQMAVIAQSTPGAIAINLSCLAGYRCAGKTGALLSCLFATLPPFILLTFISIFYRAFASNMIIASMLRGMQAGAAALIVDVVIDMCQMIHKEHSIALTLCIPITFIANYVLHIHVIWILLFCCLLCIGKILMQKGLKK